MNYDTTTMKTLTDLLSGKIGEKYLAKEIIQMKMELEDDEIINECIKRFEEKLESRTNGKEKRFFDNLSTEVSSYPNLTMGFIERHMDMIDWETLAMEQTLTEEFILKHKNAIDNWGFILEFQNLSEEALDELDEILEDNCLCDTSNRCDNCQESAEEYMNMDDHDAYYYGMTEEEREEEMTRRDLRHEDGMRNILW